jgi:hypothetical protein
LLGPESGEKMSDIPSDEVFTRADRLMAERDRNLGEVSANFKEKFAGRCPLYNFFLLWQRDVDFRAFIFFDRNIDIVECRENGIMDRMKDFVFEELKRVGRGERGRTSIDFEIDSNENVIKNYEGDYYLRLR